MQHVSLWSLHDGFGRLTGVTLHVIEHHNLRFVEFYIFSHSAVFLLVKSLIDEEAKTISTERIVIGGFSQGGAVALFTSLTNNIKLGGVLAFSTWLPLHNKVLVSIVNYFNIFLCL